MTTTTNNTGVSPIQDQVLVRRDQAKTKTESGLLYYPETSVQWEPTGTVIAIGPKVVDRDLIGKRVFFNAQAAAGRALVPDERDPGMKDEYANRIGVIVLYSGDVERDVQTGPARMTDKRYLGDIIGIIEEE